MSRDSIRSLLSRAAKSGRSGLRGFQRGSIESQFPPAVLGVIQNDAAVIAAIKGLAGWGSGGYGADGASVNIGPLAQRQIIIGSMRSLAGTPPRLIELSTKVVIDNSANLTASAFEIDMPGPGAGPGPFQVIVEGSLNSVTFFGANPSAPASSVQLFNLSGLYTNLLAFGGPGVKSAIVTGGVTGFPIIIKNLSAANTIKTFCSGFLSSVPLSIGDLGGGLFE